MYYIPAAAGVDLVYIVLMFSLSTRKARGYQLTLAPAFFSTGVRADRKATSWSMVMVDYTGMVPAFIIF
jgi:hypothetical protein